MSTPREVFTISQAKVPEVDGKMDQDHHDTGYFAVSSTADLTPMKRAGSSTEKERDGRATWLLVLSGMATTFGASLPVGYNIGVINAPSAVIQKWCSEALLQRYSITLTPATLAIVWSTIVSIFLIGGMIGSLAGSWFAHQIGRKGTLIVSGVLGVVAGILFLTCKDPHLIEFIFIGRFLVGLSSGLITGVMPMYLCEIAPPNLRGVMGVLCPLGLTFGVVFSQFMGMSWILGTEQHWHHLLALYAILIIFCGLALPFMPESPKYLYYIKGLKQRACRDMSRLRGEPLDSVSRELESQGALNEITSEGWTIARLLATRNLRLPLALTCALQAGQQTSGINAVFYYSMKIFESAGLNVAEQQYASLGAGLVNFGVAVIMLPLVNKLPHRKLTISSSCLATLTLFLLTISISYIKTYYWMPYLCVFSVMFYVLVYGIGLGPIPYFIGSELFEVGPRPSAMALGSVANWTGNFSVGMLFPSLQRVMGPYSFLIFAFCTSLLTIFLHMFLPETNPRHMYEREESHESTNTCQQSTTDRMLFKSIHDL